MVKVGKRISVAALRPVIERLIEETQMNVEDFSHWIGVAPARIYNCLKDEPDHPLTNADIIKKIGENTSYNLVLTDSQIRLIAKDTERLSREELYDILNQMDDAAFTDFVIAATDMLKNGAQDVESI